MRTVNRSALVPYSAEQMFALVDNVEAYPDFLPGCRRAEVHFRDATTVEATLELARGALRRSFRTRNTSEPGVSMSIALVEGPFQHLAGLWSFVQLGEAGCKVTLHIEFEFRNAAVDKMLGRFFEDMYNSLVTAFTQRADIVYGVGRGGDG